MPSRHRPRGASLRNLKRSPAKPKPATKETSWDRMLVRWKKRQEEADR